MVQRVEDDGASEGRTVMVRIGGCGACANITSRESGQTSIGSLGARTVGKPALRSRADDGGMSAGAASGRKACWLPSTNAQVVASHDRVSGGHGRLMSDLSCLRGNLLEQCAP
jgi:hypothetical protein